MRCGRAVSVDSLIDSLWDCSPPLSAPTTLRGHVKRLRKLLRTLSGGEEIIESVAHGYRLRADPGIVDLLRFRQLCAAASAAEDPGEEKALLSESLGLWRGPALCDLDSEALLRDLGPVLEEERIQMLQRLVEFDLQEGRYRQAITAAHRLTTDHPFQERFWEQLILALSKAGRTAEALGQFQRVRTLLSEELGVLPGPVLQDLHQQLLTQNAAEALPRRPYPRHAGESLPRPPSTVVPLTREIPCQTPPDIGHLVGRARTLETLDRLLTLDRATLPPVVVEGAAGIGKTAIAAHWAHRVRDSFPDGQLYLNLRGFHHEAPVHQYDALARLLRGLGATDECIPADLADRSALLRSLTAGKRLLVVLDNARDCAQVRLLLPAQSCVTLVTSRQQLRGLVARDGAQRLKLPALNATESIELLAAVLGREQIDATPQAASEIAQWCSGIPLALRLLAEPLTRCPAMSLAYLAQCLRDERGRLDLLETGDDETSSLRAALACSYRVLTPPGASMFRTLGRQPKLAFTVDCAAELAGTDRRAATKLLDGLVAAHLIEQHDLANYRILPLTLTFAAELARTQQSDPIARAM